MSDNKAGRKCGNRKAKCERYKTRGSRAMNKGKRLAKHLAHHPKDVSAITAVKTLRKTAPSAVRMIAINAG